MPYLCIYFNVYFFLFHVHIYLWLVLPWRLAWLKRCVGSYWRDTKDFMSISRNRFSLSSSPRLGIFPCPKNAFRTSQKLQTPVYEIKLKKLWKLNDKIYLKKKHSFSSVVRIRNFVNEAIRGHFLCVGGKKCEFEIRRISWKCTRSNRWCNFWSSLFIVCIHDGEKVKEEEGVIKPAPFYDTP